ncbi:TetR/AcrR family transcriptional regulator [Streptomyces monticola]|uniref:TetR/AcrR family transcriptional regulator n=1 Tax=Streptomyces monticola TaxID=2666263 RepID=A0ABW2JF37_9ACTN
MARPRTFDEEKAVEAACHVFWTKGYDAASTQDLCDATGLGRSSIYNTFKSKDHLFRRSLAHYMDAMSAQQVAILEEGDGSGAERIRALLSTVVAAELENRREGHGSGCFTVNTIASLASRDPQIAQILDKDLRWRLSSLRAAIEAGRRDGSVTSTRDTAGLAWYVVSVISGLRIAGQTGAEGPVLEQIAETALDALGA